MDLVATRQVSGNDVFDADDQRLIHAVQWGLPLVSRPYASVGEKIGMSEAEVITRLTRLRDQGIIKRMGVVVRHRELGYRANAMVVWDVPDEGVSELGRCLGRFNFISLCYRRIRHGDQWPYNLFCMIHCRDKVDVFEKVALLVRHCGLENIPYRILFSGRRFKQRGAIYQQPKVLDTQKGAI